MSTYQKNLYDQIDDYLNGKLSLEEKHLFEQRMKRDKKLFQIVQQYKIIAIGVKMNTRRENIEKLKEFEAALPNLNIPVQPRYSISYKILAIAAGIIIAITASIVIIQNYSHYMKYDYIYASYYQVYPNLVHAIKRGESAGNNIEKSAYHLYEQMEFEQAINLFGQLPEQKVNGAVMFYTGSSYLELGDTEKAIEFYKKGIEKYDDFSIQSTWYLGLAYLKAQKLKNAKDVFQNIAKAGNSYSNKAKEILEFLE